MSIIIVGHGPSMLKKEWGDKIDSFDYVIRQKEVGLQMMEQNPQNFGTKISALSGSATIYKNPQFQAQECSKWVFFDTRHRGWNINDENGKYVMNKPLCDVWDGLYRSMRTQWANEDHRIVSGRSSDEKGHMHLSAGLHTLIYACAILKPDAITLVGFDNVCSGNFTWSVTRGEDWKGYPDHRWDVEKRMLNFVKTIYNVKIELLE